MKGWEVALPVKLKESELSFVNGNRIYYRWDGSERWLGPTPGKSYFKTEKLYLWVMVECLFVYQQIHWLEQMTSFNSTLKLNTNTLQGEMILQSQRR